LWLWKLSRKRKIQTPSGQL